jgi:protein-S-isoprenylcysteine O-methyltransferase Ste14
MISQRKKGIKTDQLGKGKSGSTKYIEIATKISAFAVPIAEGISIILNTSCLPLSFRYIGIALAIVGDIVFICSIITMKDSWRAGVSESEKTELISNGIYKISRNPAFVGFDLIYIGIILMFFNWALLLVSIFAIIMFHLQIVCVEEPFLIRTFGDEYLNYKNTVGRYLGRKFK